MKIVIAPDSFKGSASALEVAEAVACGWQRVFPKSLCELLPMADGGEGTMDALVDATGGEKKTISAQDPLGRTIAVNFGILGDGKTAIVETAEASGLPLLSEAERNPLLASTFGTGQLIRAALAEGIERLLIGLGGSATVDAGAGLVSALGARLLTVDGQQIGHGGGSLGEIAKIELGELPQLLGKVEVLAACDVDNPLIGPQGAAAVFGPQKGANPQMVAQLDKGLSHWADIVARDLGKEVSKLPGAGAAGGLGGCLVAFLGAKLVPGIELVISSSGLEEKLQGCDLVITGEGKLDGQSARGKTPMGVAQLAARYKIPVLAIGGSIAEDASLLYNEGIGAMLSITPGPITLEEAIKRGPELLEETGERAARLFALAGWRD